MQHYGMPTTALDVTRGLDVALFFALNRFDDQVGRFFPLAKLDNFTPVLYLFVDSSNGGIPIFPGQTAVLPSEDLLFSAGPEPLPIPSRIERQRCGLLYGANVLAKNQYTRLLVGKVDLRAYSTKAPTGRQSELFPVSSRDSLYGTLTAASPIPYRFVIYHTGDPQSV